MNHFIAGADYSQLELKLIALLASDQPLLDCYNKGLDVHRITATEVLELRNGTEVERDIAKMVEYGFNYNISEDVRTVWQAAVVKLSDKYKDIGSVLTMQRMSNYRKRWFRAHPAIRQWQLTSVALAEKNKFVEAPLSGRRRYFHDGHVDPNEVLNFPMQSTAGDLMNRAMLAIDKRVDWAKEGIIAQVHDAAYLEGPDPFRLARILKECMEQTVTLNGHTMTFTVDLGIGKDWKNLYKVTKLPECSYQEFLRSLDFSPPVAATVSPKAMGTLAPTLH
jgi:DNA polymerase-1